MTAVSSGSIIELNVGGNVFSTTRGKCHSPLPWTGTTPTNTGPFPLSKLSGPSAFTLVLDVYTILRPGIGRGRRYGLRFQLLGYRVVVPLGQGVGGRNRPSL